MARKRLFIVALIAAVACTAGATDGRWLNVHVTEAEDNTTVKVHLPLSLILTVIEGINVDGFEAGKVELHMGEMDVDWQTILGSLKDAPVGEYVTVESDEADVIVKKQDNMILIDVNEKSDENAKVTVRVPLPLIDALTLDEDNRIDVAALLRGFDALPDGDLVTVVSPDANVRVWVE